jgi:hypothetical protein
LKKYRKIPVVVDAMRFFEYCDEGWPIGVYVDGSRPTGYCVDTLNGTVDVSEGEWIVRGIHGELYPCKHEIFIKTYEEVK